MPAKLFAPVVATALVLAGCSGSSEPPPPPPADRGAAAISQPMASIDDLVDWMQEKTGSCSDAKPEPRNEFRQFIGTQFAELYEPFVKEWATCSVPPNYPKVGLLLFNDMRAFQQSWRDAKKAGKVSDGPAFSFGNGFAVTAGFLGVHQLDLFYLRCDYDDPRVHQIAADVEGCVFANPEHRHH